MQKPTKEKHINISNARVNLASYIEVILISCVTAARLSSPFFYLMDVKVHFLHKQQQFCPLFTCSVETVALKGAGLLIIS